MNKDVVIIGDSGDMKLPESHQKEYNKIEIVHYETARQDGRYIGARPERGVVFIKHPYLDCFVANNDDLDLYICSAMIGDLALFAQELGARHVDFSLVISSKRLFTNKVEVQAKKGQSQGKAKSNYEKEAKAYAKLTEDRYFIRDADILSKEEFDKAKRHFENSGLFRVCDPLGTAKSMLMGRDPESNTRIESNKIVIVKKINLNEVLSIALSYKKASILKASGAYSQNKKFSKHIRIEMYVDFYKGKETPQYQ